MNSESFVSLMIANESEDTSADSLPLYTEHDEPESPFNILLARIARSTAINSRDPCDRAVLDSFVEFQQNEAPSSKGGNLHPIDRYPIAEGPMSDSLTQVKQRIVSEFFYSVWRGEEDNVELFIKNNLVTANTTSEGGATPLMCAVMTRNVRVAKQLLEFGADANAFSNLDFNAKVIPMRTPLQEAAASGHLVLVKLLMEGYNADDSLIAEDGQIALRLAAENGHRDIVEYLPARRGGGFRRWKTQHQKAIQRIKSASLKIYKFVKIFVWDIEKFLLWTTPKHLIVKPIAKGCQWCWRNRKEFFPFCKRQVDKIASETKKFGKWVWKGMKAIPKAVADTVKSTSKSVWRGIKAVPNAAVNAAKALWKFGTKTLPMWLKNVAIWIWDFLTKELPKAVAKLAKWIWIVLTQKIPKAIANLAKWIWTVLTQKILKAIIILAKWIWAGVSSTAQAFWHAIFQVASLLHTIFMAIVTFFRNLSLRDIWNGFCNVLRSIFITFPKMLASWIVAFVDVSWEFMRTAFGTLGMIVWIIVALLVQAALYVPKKLWVVLESFGSSIAKAFHEMIVLVNPKL